MNDITAKNLESIIDDYSQQYLSTYNTTLSTADFIGFAISEFRTRYIFYFCEYSNIHYSVFESIISNCSIPLEYRNVNDIMKFIDNELNNLRQE